MHASTGWSTPLTYRAPTELRACTRGAGSRRHRLVVSDALVDKPRQRQGTGTPGPVEPSQQPQLGGSAVKLTLPWPARRSWASVAVEKLLDTAEDVALHARRSVLELPTSKALKSFTEGRGQGSAMRLLSDKPVVLVLGTGWGAHSFIKVVDTDKYEVVVISPRNHYHFTPMLPSAAVGTVEFRSLMEPIRVSNPFVTYLQASCDSLDVATKVAYCTSAVEFEDGRRPTFEIPYNCVVVAVGEQPATFGVPGVAEHCFFMKEISDASALRKRIQQVFELAALPGTSKEERRRILHFVVVGGGPTGVEFAGTLNDFVTQDLRKKYAPLMPYVKVTLLQSAQSILTQFAEGLQQRALENFASSGVEVRVGVRVVAVGSTQIKLAGGEALDYGVCVWSTGNASRPIVRSIVAQLPAQQAMNSSAPPPATKLVVDPYLRVMGARDAIALGDCSLLLGDRLPATAQVAAQQGAYVARMVNRGYTPGLGGMDQPPPAKADNPQALANAQVLKPLDLAALSRKSELTELDVMAVASGDPTFIQPPAASYYRKPFDFLSLGLLAYVGNDKALTQFDAFDRPLLQLYGALAFLLWRSVYITKQVSFRNRVLILFDWMKAKVFGRDLSQF